MKTKSKNMIPMMALSLIAVLALSQDSKHWSPNFRSIANVEEVNKKPDEPNPEKKPDEASAKKIEKDNEGKKPDENPAKKPDETPAKKPDEPNPEKKPDEGKKDKSAKIDYDSIYECQNKLITDLRKDVAKKMKDLEKVLRNKRQTEEDEYFDDMEDRFSGMSKRDLLKEMIMGRMSGFNMPQFSMQPSFAMPQQMFQLPSYQAPSFAEQSITSDFNYQTELLKLQYVQQRRMMELNLNNSIGINNEFSPYSRYNRNWSIDASNLYSSSPSVYNHPYQAVENQFRPMPINDGRFYLANNLSSKTVGEQKGYAF